MKEKSREMSTSTGNDCLLKIDVQPDKGGENGGFMFLKHNYLAITESLLAVCALLVAIYSTTKTAHLSDIPIYLLAKKSCSLFVVQSMQVFLL